MIVCGIDSGKNGAIAVYDSFHDSFIFKTFEESEITMIDIPSLQGFFDCVAYSYIYIELVHALFGSSAKSTFNFGRCLGEIEASIPCYNNEVVKYCSPREWQKEMHKGIDKALHAKERSLIAIQKLYPGLDLRATPRCKKAHDGMVDAALIALYGFRKEIGLL